MVLRIAIAKRRSNLDEHGKTTGCLRYIGDYTAQLHEDYNEPLQGFLLNNRYNGKYEFFFRGSDGCFVKRDPPGNCPMIFLFPFGGICWFPGGYVLGLPPTQ